MYTYHRIYCMDNRPFIELKGLDVVLEAAIEKVA